MTERNYAGEKSNDQRRHSLNRQWFSTKSRAGALLLLLVILAVSSSQVFAEAELIRVTKGKSIVLSYPEKIKAVSIADEEVADVVSITSTELVVIGKTEGVTSLFVWGESGQFAEYDVEVDRNAGGQQVILEVQVAEVHRTAMSEYGVDFLLIDSDDRHIANGTKALGLYGGDVTAPDPLTQEMYAPEEASAAIRWMGDSQTMATVIKAMQEDGTIELLASPRLLCMSGEKASFLVGGEIPIAVPQTSTSGFSSITIEWKEYGIKLEFTPTVIDTDLINLEIYQEVSRLDWTNRITFSGWDIPALQTRKAEATIELNSGQSIVLSGLKAAETTETITRIPILGHIPLLGYFFSHRVKSKAETELMIVISPRVIGSMGTETIPPLPIGELLDIEESQMEKSDPPDSE